jgi:hypothetical protein
LDYGGKDLAVLSSASLIAQQLLEDRGISRDRISSADLLHVYRDLAVVFPFADLRQADGMLQSVKPPPIISDSAQYLGVIIETRKHHALETVVENVLDVCGIPIQLFHGNTNREFIMSTRIAELVDRGKVVLSALDADHLQPSEYNALLMSPRFWELLCDRDKVLVFQTDSLCCRQSNYRLDDFSDFDYIGCTWGRQRPVGLIIDGGVGGFSLRDWTTSMQCISRFDPSLWPGGEDGYFAFHMDLIGARVANQEESGRFGTQELFLDESFGGHRINLLQPKQLEAFMQYCPEAVHVFPDLS